MDLENLEEKIDNTLVNEEEDEASHVKYWMSPDADHDCYFIVGPDSGPTERIGAFKAFLIGHSEPLRAMLKNNNQGDITISDIYPDTFKHFLKCLYMNCENISKATYSFQEFVDLLYVAEKYLATFLKEKLVECLMAKFPSQPIKNSLIALESQVFFQDNRLVHMLTNFLKDNLKELFTHSSCLYLDMSSEAMLRILQLDPLCIAEVYLWKRVLEWATHKTNSKDGHVIRQFIIKHLKFIRFCTMDIKRFCQTVVPTNILTPNEVRDICMSHGLNESPNMEFICNDTNLRHEFKRKPFTIFHCVSASNFNENSSSQEFKFQGYLWRIELYKSDDYVHFYLRCNSFKSIWEINVKADFCVINHNNNCNLSYTLVQKFSNSETTWGCENFCGWDEIINPLNGYVNENSSSIILLVHIWEISP